FIIFICGHHELSHRQAHAARVFTSQSIAEVPRRNGENHLFFRSGKLGVSINIVNYLRQNTAKIDRVGGRQIKPSQIRVGKSLFDQVLAIIKFSSYTESMDITADGIELFFLPETYFFGRIKNSNVNSCDSLKSLTYCASGIAGCSYQDIDAFTLGAAMTHESSHHPRGKIFE